MDKLVIASMLASNVNALKSVLDSEDQELWDLTLDRIAHYNNTEFCKTLIAGLQERVAVNEEFE